MEFKKIQNMSEVAVGGGGAQWANFRGQVEIIIGLVSDNHIFISM